jgi:DNA gyrase subunit A
MPACIAGKFRLSEIPAKAILEMRLQRLTGLERDKIEAEYRELLLNQCTLDRMVESREKPHGLDQGRTIEIRDSMQINRHCDNSDSTAASIWKTSSTTNW